MVAISAGTFHTVALQADGTVLAVGRNDEGQCNVSDWKDIIAVAAGGYHTVGLKADGTVVAVGKSSDGQCRINSWDDIVYIAAGPSITAGIKSDGTVIATGDYNEKVQNWTDIIQIACGNSVYGLNASGNILGLKNLTYSYQDGVTLACDGSDYAIVRSDGTIRTNGGVYTDDFDSWSNIKTP